MSELEKRFTSEKPTFDLEEYLVDKYMQKLVNNPTDEALKSFKLTKRYPNIDWRVDFDGNLKRSVWRDIDDSIKLEIMRESKKINDQVRKTISSMINRFNDLDNIEQVDKACEIFDLFMMTNKQQKENTLNNNLLANSIANAIRTGILPLWRFVCMPELSMKTEEKQFVEWKYKFGTRRYDTLTPALGFDCELIDSIRNIGIKPRLTFVIDDWEAPWLRAKESYGSLSNSERAKSLNALGNMRGDIRSWINKIIPNSIDSDVLFLSSLMKYDGFTDLIDQINIEDNATYKGIFEEEYRFVTKARPDLTEFERRKRAELRISQYAVEGSIIASSKLKNGIYLNSEYPTTTVWKKLTLLADIPTLFYVNDSDVKNI